MVNVPINIKVVIGSKSFLIKDLLKIKKGSIITLENKIGDSVNLYANNVLIAKGELIVCDEYLGLTITKIIKH